MDKIAVLVPCYNEAQTIKKVVEWEHWQVRQPSV